MRSIEWQRGKGHIGLGRSKVRIFNGFDDIGEVKGKSVKVSERRYRRGVLLEEAQES